MSKKGSTTVVMRSDDYLRALLSDTTPSELPIIISNDGFYKNMKNFETYTGWANEFFTKVLLPNDDSKRPSKPLSIRIIKDETSHRRLGLPHPRAQLEVARFYEKFEDLIPYYCQRSSFSLRQPRRVAGRYYISNPNENIYSEKKSTVTTLDNELISKHPASFFAYSGFHRLHEFFNSPLYNSLERRFAKMCMLDISNCFGNIYTHSITWATKSQRKAKAYTGAEMYGSAFDRTMQVMNYNETNGIVIGPEISRIFAETILSRIDFDVEHRLKMSENNKLTARKNYAIGRYVDNYYIFYDQDQDLNQIKIEIEESLSDYKLAINEKKTELVSRPFYTKKSMVISELNSLLKALVDPLTSQVKIGKATRQFPSRILSTARLFKAFASSLRRACYVSGVGYEDVTSYVTAALKLRLKKILEDGHEIYELAPDGRAAFNLPNQQAELDALYSQAIKFHLEAAFHTFSLCPNVASSLNLASMLVQSAEFLRKTSKDDFYSLREKVQLWTASLIETQHFSRSEPTKHVTAIEVLNILCALRAFGFDGTYFSDAVDSCRRIGSSPNYFSIVTKLYLFQDDEDCASLKMELISSSIKLFKENSDLSLHSSSLHLLLDLLACPYLDIRCRRLIFREAMKAHNAAQRDTAIPFPNSNTDLDKILSQFAGRDWFVDWKVTNLKRMIEKKQLSRAYE
ncbi:RNA-directed DNA polymerase [Paracoccus gahaiensis]|uniref:RNA-directed DNA polymerase n=1 Tax=Paracoccus gahaiensis TaxID=1706839 RepID=A0A4U0R3Q7_9RHOB|nr:antiviral reverse transcriptase Drt3b [Paracoccus gahaiensis]TJZ89246.1 RNA-directed DNA polymerase [Paracoccus gahaiensis]